MRIFWLLVLLSAAPALSADDETRFDGLAMRSRTFARGAGALEPADWLCDLPDAVLWAARAGDGISVARLKKGARGRPAVETYKPAAEAFCGMNQCDQEWIGARTGRPLAVHDMHLLDLELGQWGPSYRLSEEADRKGRAWRACAGEKFEALRCVTKRRVAVVTRDLQGRAFYRTENFDGGAGVRLEGAGPDFKDAATPQRFVFKKDDYSYEVRVDTASGASISVSKGGRRIQEEDCRAFSWARPAPLDGD